MPSSKAIVKGVFLLAVGAAVADVNTVGEADALKPFGLKNPLNALKKAGQVVAGVDVRRVPGALGAGAGMLASQVTGNAQRQAAERKQKEIEREREFANIQRNHQAIRKARNYDRVRAELEYLQTGWINQGDPFALKYRRKLEEKIRSGTDAWSAVYDLKAEMGQITRTTDSFYAKFVSSDSSNGGSSRSSSPVPSMPFSRSTSPIHSRSASPAGSDNGEVRPFTNLWQINGDGRLRGSTPSNLVRPTASRSVASSGSGSRSSAYSHKTAADQWPQEGPRSGIWVPGFHNLAGKIADYGGLTAEANWAFRERYGYHYHER